MRALQDAAAPRDNLPEGTAPLPWGSKGICPYPWGSLTLCDRHPPTALPSLQPNTNQKGAESKAGKESEQLKVGIKKMSRKILNSCIYTPAQPSKAMIMQHRASEYVMNISLDFGTQENPTRRQGLNLAAGTQKISPFITPSLQKIYPHVGIRRPFRVNLIILFLWSLRTSELNTAEQQPTLWKQQQSGRVWGFHSPCRKERSPGSRGICVCCHVESLILHWSPSASWSFA